MHISINKPVSRTLGWGQVAFLALHAALPQSVHCRIQPRTNISLVARATTAEGWLRRASSCRLSKARASCSEYDCVHE
jgi:hypothetical protein